MSIVGGHRIPGRWAWLPLAAAALVLAALGTVWATGGVYTQTKHGNSRTGVNRTRDWPVASCGQCHVQHGVGAPNPFALFMPNTNGLCATAGCHGAPAPNQLYQGPVVYDASSHGTSTVMVWPGRDATVDPGARQARVSGDAGKCVNCHTPHGNRDSQGLIPGLVFSREEKLCLVCHDGSPASKNVKMDLGKVYRHPIGTITGRHDEAEGGTAPRYSALPVNNRHAECVDCHNAHVAKADGAPPTPPAASNRLAGVSRVAVTNGAAGTIPIYTYRGPADASPPLEYEICFKCHSSWTTLPVTTPSGGTPQDKAVQFNPNNRSYHPVEAAGKNANINPAAFVNAWTATRLMYCTDCHTGDSPARGSHGSAIKYILPKAYAAISRGTMGSGDLCFDCHKYNTYANNAAGVADRDASRFSGGHGHAFHVEKERIACFACHDSHGSATLPHLMVTGRGLTSYTETSGGGSCAPTCHGSESYTVRYAR